MAAWACAMSPLIMTRVLLLLLCTATAAAGAPVKPNILLMLTDDQDIMLGGYPSDGEPMSQTRRLIQEMGAIATQWRIHTPICGPSRAELQSGRYYHNIASKALTPPSCLGGGVDSHGGLCLGSGAVGQVDLGRKVWPHLFPAALRRAGYSTALFGKCMNGDCGANAFASGKNLHTMDAFDRW
jgi:N-acetylglucosamine-6-sulfatase